MIPATMYEREAVAKAFGETLREIRLEKGFTQDMLALQCELDHTYPSLLERGLRHPSLVTLLNIAAVLQTKPHVLVKRTLSKLQTPEPISM